jgi:DNA-binding NtrC family response regulator
MAAEEAFDYNLPETAIEKRALVVDDDILIRGDIADALRAANWEVIEAGTADEAIEVLSRDNSFHLVITDVHMPGMKNGLDLAREVNERHPGIKVAVMSGQHLPTAEDRAIFDLFLLKPVFNIASALTPLIGDTHE